MNFFEIDFTKRVMALLKAAFSFKKYKEMPAYLCVFVGIFMLPIVAAALGVALCLIVFSFLFNISQQPIKFMHSVLTTEGQKISAAAQFVIYFVAWPLIFFLYVILSFTLIYIAIFYAVLSLLCYLWTLGATKPHVIITEDVDDLNKEIVKDTGKGIVIPWVYVIVNAVIYIFVPFVMTIAHTIDRIRYIEFGDIIAYFVESSIGNIYISVIFSIIYSAIFFTLYLKKKAGDAVVEEPTSVKISE